METQQERTALVTGAAGFVGSHLVDHLLAAGWRVRGLDDLSTGRIENLQDAAASSDFDLIEGSVLHEPTVRAASSGAGYAFHLAGHVGAAYVEQEPERTVLDTVQAARAMLAVAGDHKTPLFFASTSEIYGDSVVQPLREDADIIITPPHHPRASYALGKGVGELLVNTHVRSGGRAVIGRLFNTVGPRQSERYGSVLPTFAGRALTNQPLIVHGSGEQTRSFTDVGDVVSAITVLLLSPAANGETVNIGSTEEIRILDLARLVVQMTKSSSSVEHRPFAEVHGFGAHDVRRRIPDTGKLHRLTGRSCNTALASSIHTIIDQMTTVPAVASRLG